MSKRTHRIGCGYASCRRPGGFGQVPFYVCNYASGQYRLDTPYTSGARRCSDCPESCKNGLCDCNGKLCLNSGTLDINKCICKCQKTYTGSDCSVLSCPKEDVWWCKDTPVQDCKKYSNYPYDCPYHCGVCSKTGTKTGTPANNAPPPPAPANPAPKGSSATFISPHGCKFTGQRATAAQCKKYGKKGSDKRFCQSVGGDYTCEDCTRLPNVKTDYCPVMCGLCDAPCGMVCLHKGVLDPDTCTCKCRKKYKGRLCETHV
ncbi:cysteine-rich venom protein Mr30 [Elysia marginata]|uniref:Cysteine-rich venom protein Mr30 n=1 Tax=Elysia marginata TaxID=1093978 RepID=A0AAV4JW85_9GAST|nr:cysteine-rich venom protein Mr30 [Elysia marginata]